MKSLTSNECWMCGDYTTPEGFLCRKHWDLLPGKFKSELQNWREAAINAVELHVRLNERNKDKGEG